MKEDSSEDEIEDEEGGKEGKKGSERDPQKNHRQYDGHQRNEWREESVVLGNVEGGERHEGVFHFFKPMVPVVSDEFWKERA